MSESPRRSPRVLRTVRLEAFSDGVFAIAITLLVLDIAVPSGASESPMHELFSIHQVTTYLAYIVSFATIGALWVSHSTITEYLSSADSTLVRLNLLLLLVVSFLPFPTRLLGEFYGTNAERVAVTIYGLTILAAQVVVAMMWRYAMKHGLLDVETDTNDLDLLSARLAPGLAFYGVFLLLGWVFPYAVLVGYLVLAIFFLLPFPIRRRHAHA